MLLAGGGTGGHVFPALATAAALRAADPGLQLGFIGVADRLEARLVPEAGYPLHTVAAPALSRRFSPAALGLPFTVARAVAQARRTIAQTGAGAAATFGGYTSLPLALAARLAGIPLVVHEQNAVPGVANRLAARVATAVAVSFPGTPLPRAVLTGNPVRPEVLPPDGRRPDPAEGRAHFGLLDDRTTLLVFGGSQGARRINQAVVAASGLWTAPEQLQILHATGRATAAETRRAWRAAAATPLHTVVVEFIERMDLAYAAADVVVCRAGASSMAELTALGVPSVLVPYPHATGDHQTANARGLTAAGGAVRVPDSELDAARLVAEAEPLLLDADARARMAAAAADFGRPDAAAALAALVLAHFPHRQAHTR
ncbi:MAG: undecaprenyldiphospho-muramoylpentapeptide beta-N-acetylglucosaminyltransferase [Actinobacteria bacterium]|nr:undecaprenyldiphospho-muramoylpentapeptide beta-N-acetylglucosaminyltransferase [Actinomycetota bacterium]